MITHQSPYDYQKRVILVDQLARVCQDCGSYAGLLSAGWVCCKCKSTNVIEMLESEVADYRKALAWAAEAEKAQRYIDGTCDAQEEPETVEQIAAKYHCSAVIARDGYDLQDEAEQADYRRLIAALNETQADDKPAVNEAPFVDDFSLPGYDYLSNRRETILAAFKEEPLTPDKAGELIEELAELETKLQEG